MGTDIHFYVEKRVNGAWQSADKWVVDKYEDEPGLLTVEYDDQFYNGRNYNLFAILADVRNGRGFAGIKTGAGFNPIMPPRGMPDDASDLLKKEFERGGDHTPGWLTVAEILAFDWTQTTTLSGIVNGPNYAGWSDWDKKDGHGPKQYCGSISGPRVRHVTEPEMKKFIEAIGALHKDYQARRAVIEQELSDTYCEISWTARYSQCCKDFLGDTVFRLLPLGKPEDVRAVFWFDS